MTSNLVVVEILSIISKVIEYTNVCPVVLIYSLEVRDKTKERWTRASEIYKKIK